MHRLCKLDEHCTLIRLEELEKENEEKTKRKTFSPDGAASPCYPNTMGVVAEALGEGRFGGGGVVVSDTLAHVLRASEPTAVALWRGTKRRRQYDPRHWSVKPFPLFAF